MLTDEQLAEHLGARLKAETAGITSSPDLVRTLHRAQVRHVWAVRAGVAVPAVAVAVSLVASGVADRPGQITAGRPAASAAPSMVDVAYVQANTVKALAAASDSLVRAKGSAAAVGLFELTMDRSTGRFRSDGYRDGRKVASGGLTADLHTMLLVNYENRTWSATPVTITPSGGIPKSPFSDPQEIRDALTNGKAVLVGNEKVDGRDTVHLRLSGHPSATGPGVDLWVDATSYLPVRTAYVMAKPATGMVLDYTWLERTDENLAALNLTVPAGFRRV
ncbi:hypothetical protein [Hamadaea tsunoensis]|uniref:hypothetical protein n=1 Tax=Hamadaea tsunoensis TaxID=53368 RepID=UPI000408DA82|nr:hypothetical protein [Hamadaea tsunoensis]